jgi:hypothetical protein
MTHTLRSSDRGLGSRSLLVPCLLSLCLLLPGCVVFDGVLNADGSGTLEMTYAPQAGATQDSEKKRFSSSNVTVESVSLTPDRKKVTIRAKVDDVTKIATAEGFKNVEVARTKEGADEKLVIKVKNEKTYDLKDNKDPGPRFTITFPGAVKRANRNAKIEGSKVTWTFGLAEYAKASMTDLEAVYTPAGDAKPADAKPADAKPADAKPAAAKPADAKPADAKKK